MIRVHTSAKLDRGQLSLCCPLASAGMNHVCTNLYDRQDGSDALSKLVYLIIFWTESQNNVDFNVPVRRLDQNAVMTPHLTADGVVMPVT
jgi:hypothetical protein